MQAFKDDNANNNLSEIILIWEQFQVYRDHVLLCFYQEQDFINMLTKQYIFNIF